MAADGTGQENLTPNRGSTEDWAPAIDANGTTIYFTSRLFSAIATGDE